ncbi:MAG: Gfo/Idh/MocA family oxidoreductase [Anaerolineae bacterium]|nr:Gfo/Idh/MocA family oxidoreductase [Anaerolineae bacterium]
MTNNFALTGIAGFVAPRHLRAIKDTGNQLIAALDPHDSVGILDQYFPNTAFFTEPERFDRFLERLRHDDPAGRLHYLSICAPNYLHDAHIRMALRLHANAICEKPLVINPWNLDPLEDLEAETGCRVYTVLQLRLLPVLRQLKATLDQESASVVHDVSLTYITRRGRWYNSSWKGSHEHSGGLAMNIGIHFFDLLLWFFGKLEHSELHLGTPQHMAGSLLLERARVNWFLSIDEDDLPTHVREQQRFAFRSITIDGQEIEFSDGFTDLHTRVYQDILAGGGFGLRDARPSIDLVYQINSSEVVPVPQSILMPNLR